MLLELKKQIDKDVYGTGQSNKYKRTYQLREAWKVGVAKNVTNSSSSIRISFDPSKIDSGDHVSLFGDVPFDANLFSQLFSKENLDRFSGHTSGAKVGIGSPNERFISNYHRPFWERYMERMTKRGGIRKIMEKYAKGVTVDQIALQAMSDRIDDFYWTLKAGNI